MTKEGWAWLYNSRVWHYFRDGRSLCGRWMNLGGTEFDSSPEGHDRNCAACLLKRQKEEDQSNG